MTRAAGSPRVRAAALLLLLLAAVVAAVTLDLPTVGQVRDWLDAVGPVAWLAVVLGQAAVLMTPAPRSALSVLVGAIAGFPAGLPLVISGGLLGGLLGYALSRRLGREAVTRLAGARLTRVDGLLHERGFVPVLIARVMPVLPFMAVSYAAGLSAVRPVPYTAGTVVGILPGSVVYVGVGASMTLVDWAAAPVRAALLPVALLLLVLPAVALRRRRRQRSAS